MESATTEPTVEESPFYKNYFDYLLVKPRLDNLIGDWSYYRTRALENRNARYIKLDPEELRQKGAIQQSETMIPIRTIDTNIKREKADAMAFLNSANRLAYFHCIDDPNIDCRQLESDFTKGLTYTDWYIDYDRHYDGAALHGWDSMEVVYDESKPLHVAIEQIGFDKLIYNPKVRNIQDSSFLLMEKQVTALNLQSMIDESGFDARQIELILRPDTSGNGKRNDDRVYTIYKVYFKYDNCVYVGWYSRETGAQDWIKAPEHLRCGILVEIPKLNTTPSIGASILGQSSVASDPILNENQGGNIDAPISLPVPQDCIASNVPGYWERKLVNYPIFRYTYLEDEQQCINDKVGRAFLDLPQQEANTAITSGYVNRTIKSSDVYATWKTDIDEHYKLEEVVLENGVILPPIEFFHMPAPDPEALRGLQYLSSVNAEATGKIASSVANREDSRKTAKELSLAEQEQSKISSTSLATYNDFIRNIYTFAWLIVQAQALANRVKLSLKPLTTVDANQIPSTVWVNDTDLIKLNFDVRAAGEIDVLQKNVLINSMQQDWPVVQNTPIAQPFLEDYVRLRYPLRADYYISVMKQGDPGKAVAKSLLGIITAAEKDPQQMMNPSPENRNQMAGIINAAMNYVNPPQQGPSK